MKTHCKNCFAGLLCSIALLLQTPGDSFARTKFNHPISKSTLRVTCIEMEGRIQSEEGAMSEVTITVYVDTVLFMTTTSNRSGKCRITLPIDQKYTVVFTSAGYITKKIVVNAQVASTEHSLSTLHFTVDMLKDMKQEMKTDQVQR